MLKRLGDSLIVSCFLMTVSCMRNPLLTGHKNHFPGLPAFFSVLQPLHCVNSEVEGVAGLGLRHAQQGFRIPSP